MINAIHDDPLSLPASLLSLYPGVVHVRVKANIATYKSAQRSLLTCVECLLKSRGRTGVLTVLDASQPRLLSFYLQLGFCDVTPDAVLAKDLVVLGKRI